ncbi:hypothetical protein HS141_14410 [Cetobacterium somerae]|uniref:hypothetical protein n=1 Tax=Cetobacterium somerae TaxID=188913 RepID=UPI00211E0CFA|nr:hypothetical protein [Cetobacterium somerae]MCQ9628110.1 hypothetical protein [Cetobacterium somerae]
MKIQKKDFFILGVILSILIVIFTNTKESAGKLTINYLSSEKGGGQLFYDSGNGFSETNSYKFSVKSGRNTFQLSLPKEKIVRLRLDPIDEKDILIENLVVKLESNKQINELIIENYSGVKIYENKKEILTENEDPILVFKDINIFPKKGFNYQLFFIEFFTIGIIYIMRRKILENKNIVSVFILIFCLNILRSPDALLTSIIYTEDGVWTSKIMRNGIIDTLINARKDYFVVGNILLLYISYTLNKLSNLGLGKLPYFISIVSYIFYTSSYTYIYFVLEKLIKNKYIKILLILLICFIPFGNSLNELLGRISNIGYIIPVLLLVSILSYENNIERLGIYFIGILGMLTNPISFIYLGLYFLYRLIKVNDKKYFKEIFSFIFLKITYILSFSLIFWRYITIGNNATLTSEKLLKENILESLIGRSFLYPFCFPYYMNLTNIKVIILAILFVMFGMIIYKKSSKKDRELIIQIFIGWIVYTLMALIMRPGLTNWIKNYSNTFPDRYFYAQNLLAIILVLVLIDRSLEIIKIELFGKILLIIISTIYLNNIFMLIEFGAPKMKFNGKTFEESLVEEMDLSKENIIVPIVPKGWIMDIPTKEIY